MAVVVREAAVVWASRAAVAVVYAIILRAYLATAPMQTETAKKLYKQDLLNRKNSLRFV